MKIKKNKIASRIATSRVSEKEIVRYKWYNEALVKRKSQERLTRQAKGWVQRHFGTQNV